MPFKDEVASIVQGILADSTQWPPEMSYAIPQLVAQSPVTAPATGIIDYDTQTSSPSTAGTTFGAGADILSSPLSFSADGKSDYVVWVICRDWSNSGANRNELHFNLDGSEAGFLTQEQFAAGSAGQPITAAGVLSKPAVGSHTINVRLVVNAGTGTMDAGTGGAGASPPILVYIKRLAIGS